MDQITAVLNLIGLPPVLAGSAIALAIIIRLARARLTWFTWSVGYGVALAFSVGIAFSERAELKNVWTSALAMVACVLLLQGVLQALAGVIPGLPRDNQLAPTKAPDTQQGGTQ